MKKQGKFIVIEGGEGSGKGTQIELLQKELGEYCAFTREPGGTPIGENIRHVLLQASSSGMAPEAELLLFYASRAQNLKEKIIPAILSGKHVISDRFSLSTVAYQVYARERLEHLPFCHSVDRKIVGKWKPTLTILLDMDPEAGQKRVQNRKTGENNRLDNEALAFHLRVREGYLKEIQNIPHAIIDADRTIEEVYADLSRIVKDHLSK